MPCLRQADLVRGVFVGNVPCFSSLSREQEHLCLKLRQQQGSAHRNSWSQAQGQCQVKIPGKEPRRSLGFPPISEVLLLAHLLGLHWGLRMDNTGSKRNCKEFPKDTDIGMLTQSRKKGSGLAPGCRPQPLLPPLFPCRRGKTELSLFSIRSAA